MPPSFIRVFHFTLFQYSSLSCPPVTPMCTVTPQPRLTGKALEEMSITAWAARQIIDCLVYGDFGKPYALVHSFWL